MNTADKNLKEIEYLKNKIYFIYDTLNVISKQREDNREIQNLFKENKLKEEKKINYSVGKHFFILSKPECFKALEREQTELIKNKDQYLKEKAKLVKQISQLNPPLHEFDLELAKEILDLRGVEYDDDA